jgi:hypothetical protein
MRLFVATSNIGFQRFKRSEFSVYRRAIEKTAAQFK